MTPHISANPAVYQRVVGLLDPDIFEANIAHRARVRDKDGECRAITAVGKVVDDVTVLEKNMGYVSPRLAGYAQTTRPFVPDHTVPDDDVLRVRRGCRRGGLDADLVIVVTQETIGDKHILAVADVNAVAVLAPADLLHVAHGHMAGAEHGDTPAGRIEQGDPLDQRVIAVAQDDGGTCVPR